MSDELITIDETCRPWTQSIKRKLRRNDEKKTKKTKKTIVAGRKKRSWPSRPIVLPCKTDCESEVKGKDTGETYSCSSFVRVYLGEQQWFSNGADARDRCNWVYSCDLCKICASSVGCIYYILYNSCIYRFHIQSMDRPIEDDMHCVIICSIKRYYHYHYYDMVVMIYLWFNH